MPGSAPHNWSKVSEVHGKRGGKNFFPATRRTQILNCRYTVRGNHQGQVTQVRSYSNNTRFMAEQESKENEGNVKSLWPPQRCYPKEIFLDPSKAEEYSCLKCGLITRDACAMACAEHENDEDGDEENAKMKIFGEKCVSSHLRENDNKCPQTNHENAKYEKIRVIERTIKQLKVKCPRAMEAKLASEAPSQRFPPFLPSFCRP